ncbi:MAG: LamG domain-containing protein [bacterium]
MAEGQNGSGDNYKIEINELQDLSRNIVTGYSTTNWVTIYSLLSSQDLIAFYPFNGNANDVSVNNHNGIANGPELTEDMFEDSNSAYSFDGSNDYIEIPDDADFNFGTGSFTVSAWINTDDTTSYGTGRDDIVAKGDPTISGFAISIENNRAVFFIGNSGECWGSSTINDGQWHHIAATRNDSHNTALYVDGILESSGSNSENVNTDYSMFIGKHGTWNESFFNGLIDDVIIYHQALTSEQIQMLAYDENI